MAKKKAKKDGINRRHIEQEYGLSYALFKSDDELHKLLKDAVKHSWTAQRFQVELRNTTWFKKHSDTWREGTALKYSDPQTYRQKVAEQLMTVQAIAGKYGIRLDTPTLNRLAERSLLFGWSAGDIQNSVANYVVPSKTGDYGGDLSSIQTQLEQTALANGVRVGDNQLKSWMKAIVKGQASGDQYEQYIREVAAKTFSAYGDQIKAGMNAADLASPYIQSMSQILEINPQSIDMYDPTLRKAMAFKDEKGNNVPMGISDFERSLRQDRRWQYTKNAKDAARGFTEAIGQMWGLQ